MTASLGASVLVILTFFAALCIMLMLAVHIESTLQTPRHRRLHVPVRNPKARAGASAPPGTRRPRPRM